MIRIEEPFGSVRGLTFSPDSRLLIWWEESQGAVKALRFWDLAANAPARTIDLGDWWDQCALSLPTGCYAMADSSGFLAVRSLEKGRVDWEQPFPAEAVGPMAFTPDGRRLAVAALRRGPDGEVVSEVRGWYAATGEKLSIDFSPEGYLNHLLFLADDRLLVTGNTEPQGRVWDLSTGRQVTRFGEGHRIRLIALSPDEHTLAAVTGDQSVRLWDLHTGVPSDVVRDTGLVSAVAFHPDGVRLATGNAEGLVRFWEPANPQPTATFDWGLREVTGVAFSPDGLMCAARAAAGQIVVWDVDS